MYLQISWKKTCKTSKLCKQVNKVALEDDF